MATLTSISLVINPSTVSINDTASFYVLANYSDGTSGPVTDSCTFTLGTEGITAIPSLVGLSPYHTEVPQDDTAISSSRFKS